MPKYVHKALEKLNHIPPSTTQNAPHKWVPITFGNNPQQIADVDTSPFLNDKEIKTIQRIVGTFIYYSRAVDNTIHPALNDIASNQAKPT